MAPRPPGAPGGSGGAAGDAAAGAAGASGGDSTQAKFSLRSTKFTGVYRSRRSQEGWRAQFCYANKVCVCVGVVVVVCVGVCRLSSSEHAASWRSWHVLAVQITALGCQFFAAVCCQVLCHLNLNAMLCCAVRPHMYTNKQVINLGTFTTEEEAARVWNEAALLFRGE